jgi:hypothetical protein
MQQYIHMLLTTRSLRSPVSRYPHLSPYLSQTNHLIIPIRGGCVHGTLWLIGTPLYINLETGLFNKWRPKWPWSSSGGQQ